MTILIIRPGDNHLTDLLVANLSGCALVGHYSFLDIVFLISSGNSNWNRPSIKRNRVVLAALYQVAFIMRRILAVSYRTFFAQQFPQFLRKVRGKR